MNAFLSFFVFMQSGLFNIHRTSLLKTLFLISLIANFKIKSHIDHVILRGKKNVSCGTGSVHLYVLSNQSWYDIIYTDVP